MGKNYFFPIFFLLFPTITYAYTNPNLRDKVIEATLYCMETKQQSSSQALSPVKENIPLFAFSDNTNNTYLTLGLEFGYLKGNTAYDFDHHTSELEFPMDNGMFGGKFALGLKDLSFNAEIWTQLDRYAGFQMKDKDWTDGVLVSYTKSKAYMDAIICDANLRYDFYKKNFPEEEEALILAERGITRSDLLKFDQIKIGALLGYRYERFDFDMYDLWYQYDGPTTHQGEKVLTYKIKYYLPYLGLAADLCRENFGLGMNIKYSLYPSAYDVDNHLLRGLTFYADYDKNKEALFGSIYGFWEFIKGWKLKAGADGTFIRIDGRTWEENRDPSWDKDQSTDAKHWMFWSGIEYKF